MIGAAVITAASAGGRVGGPLASDAAAWLLGLRDLRPGAPGVEVALAHDVPPWAWFAVFVASCVVAGWCYWRIASPLPARIALASVRVLILMLLALLIARPQLVRPSERVERDWVVMLLDRSGSMLVADAPARDGAAGRTTRLGQQQHALASAAATLGDLSRDRNVLWLGFDSAAYDIAPPLGEPAAASGDGPDVSPASLGRATDLSRAIEQALERTLARPVAGIVVMSDGRTFAPPPKALVRRLQNERIEVIGVPLGSAVPTEDLAIMRAEAPPAVFPNDIVPVNVEVSSSGTGEGQSGPARRATVELVDAGGRVAGTAEVELTPDDPGRPSGPARGRGTVSVRPDGPGAGRWTVRLADAGADLAPENNTASVGFEVIEKPVRVLYIDGYPRWEYRYLKNILVREPTIRAQALLLAGDRRYIQEGTEPVTAIPVTAEQWGAYDVVILGDVRAELFSDAQLDGLRARVSERGGGLLWIGGPSANPASFAATALADLLPFSLRAGPGEAASAERGTPAFAEPVVVSRAPGAERLGLLNLGESPDDGWPAFLTNAALGWTPLRYAQRIDPQSVKPTAEVLATASVPGDATSAGATPLVLTMRYGSGRSLYVATDEIWRWRYARGEQLPERFWLPLIRLLARESLLLADKPATIEVSPARAAAGQPVRVTVRVLDQKLAQSGAASLGGEYAATDGPDAAPQKFALTPEPGARDRSAATIIPTAPGLYRVSVADPALGGITLEASLEVVLPDDERREPQADHALLASLAEATGGEMLDPDKLDDLPGLLPNRQIRVSEAPEVDPLWDTPLALGLLLLLLTIEWVGRRLVRLV